jgi:flagellar assembly factor FliW
MQTKTKYFGTLNYDEGRVVEFPAGLPGFEAERRFLLLEDAARKAVIFLQSLRDPQLCFLTLPALAVDPGYRLRIPADDLRLLDFAPGCQPAIGNEVDCLVILSAIADGSLTANLLAPLVIRAANGRAVQAVRDDFAYGCRHPLGRPSPSC